MSFVLVRVVLWVGSLALLLVAAGTDLRARIIPNRIVILIAANGVALSLLSQPEQVWIGLTVAALLLSGLGTFAYYRHIGAGDAKLIAAVSLLVPAHQIGSLLMAIAFAGGLLSIVYLVAYRVLKPVRVRRKASLPAHHRRRKNWWSDERVRLASGTSVPYALAVFGGVGAHVASELYRCLYATFCSL